MAWTEPHFRLLIQQARDGEASAAGQLIGDCRDFLHDAARRAIPRLLQSRIDPADLVQDAALKAHRDLSQFAGARRSEFLCWLHRILLNTAASAYRHHIRAARRKASREVQWSETVGDLIEPWEDLSNPYVRIITLEQQERLNRCLDMLPARMRRAIELRNRERLSFADIGERMQLSAEASRKLWLRALERLRRKLRAPDDARRD